MDRPRPDLITTEGLSASIIWDPPVPLRRSGIYLTTMFVVTVLVASQVPPVRHPGYGYEAPTAKARQDLDCIRQVITLHDSQNHPLRGTSLLPLVGRYLQELPLDPWGNDYLIDADVGVVVSRGSDGVLGPAEEYDARDIITDYKGPLRIVGAEFTGGDGTPRPGDTVKITWSKPYRIRQGRDPLRDLGLSVGGEDGYWVPLSGDSFLDQAGGPVEVSTTKTGWIQARWIYDEEVSRTNDGGMVIRCVAPTSGHPELRDEVRIDGDVRVDVSPKIIRRIDGHDISLSVIEALPAAGGPCDAGVYGPAAIDPGRAIPVGSGGVAVELMRE